jgi:hypothetical protein
MYERRIFRGESGTKEAEILFRYYLGRPVLLRGCVLLVSYTVAFVVAATVRGRLGSLAPYGITIAAMIAGEVVIQSWRRHRDRELAAVKGELSPLT